MLTIFVCVRVWWLITWRKYLSFFIYSKWIYFMSITGWNCWITINTTDTIDTEWNESGMEFNQKGKDVLICFSLVWWILTEQVIMLRDQMPIHHCYKNFSMVMSTFAQSNNVIYAYELFSFLSLELLFFFF